MECRGSCVCLKKKNKQKCERKKRERSSIIKSSSLNLHIQRNPYQNNTSILHRARTNSPKICMEAEKTPNSQSNSEKESQSWRHHNSRIQAALQSCNHQDSMVLAQKQTHRSMKQNREPRNGSTNIWPTNL